MDPDHREAQKHIDPTDPDPQHCLKRSRNPSLLPVVIGQRPAAASRMKRVKGERGQGLLLVNRGRGSGGRRASDTAARGHRRHLCLVEVFMRTGGEKVPALRTQAAVRGREAAAVGNTVRYKASGRGGGS
jgi:hypothetical protein